jgi:hypothetical protein
MTDITIDRSALAEAWVDGFLEALRKANVPEDRFAPMLADSMPEDVHRELVVKDAHERAHAARLEWEAEHLGPDGDYVDLGGGRVIERAKYDPAVHGPLQA